MGSEIVKYQASSGEVTLSHDIVAKYLVSGKGKCTEQETEMFIQLCKYRGLNPFLKDAYLVKYGESPATMIVGKDALLKRASKNPKYQGHRTGISDDGEQAWAEVFVEGYAAPVRCEVDYEEYVGLTGQGQPNAMWKSKPRTMLKKVALCQALREAFPEDLGGMYEHQEMGDIQIVDKQTGEIKEPAKGGKPAVKPPQKKEVAQVEAKSRIVDVVENVTKKEAVNKAGKAYTLFTIYTKGGGHGMKFTTFSDTFASVASSAKDAGLKVAIDYDTDKFGHKITALDITEEAAEGQTDLPEDDVPF